MVKRIQCLATLLLLAVGSGCGRWQSLPQTTQPGAAASTLAELEALPAPAGTDAQVFAALKAELRRVLLSEQRTGSATPPQDDASAAQLEVSSGGELTWTYYSTGDYDQNGEVNLGDLTQLGKYFGSSSGGGPFDPTSLLSVADGDGNGQLTIADVTPIGKYFGNLVTGYCIMACDSLTGRPSANGAPDGYAARTVGMVPLSSGSGTGRREFTYSLGGASPGYYWVRPTDGTTLGTASNAAVPPGDTLGAGGGAFALDGIVIAAPAGSLVGDVQFSHTLVAPHGGFPPDFTPAAQSHEISVDKPELLDAPVFITLPYDDTGMGASEENIMVLHYNGSGYEPTTLQQLDTAANTVTFDTRNFSEFNVGSCTPEQVQALAPSFSLSFDPAANGWDIANFGEYFSPSGNCLGMSAYACWFYKHRQPAHLFGKYSTGAGEPTSIAHLTATRAHLAQSQFWGVLFNKLQQFALSDSQIGWRIRYNMLRFNEPQILTMFGDGIGHASVVYGWDADGFLFYDVNYPGAVQHLPWSFESGFGGYSDGSPGGGFVSFGYVASPSWGRPSDFAGLTAEAEGEFTTSSDITLDSPMQDAFFAVREAQLTGTLSGSLVGKSKLVCYVKGQRMEIPVVDNYFSSTIPVNEGRNTLVLMAGLEGAQSSWYQNGATLVRDFNGLFPKAELLVTLTWAQQQADADLYVTEPGDTDVSERSAYWKHKTSTNGLDLDFDVVPGLGPEHVTLYWIEDEGSRVLPGKYRIRVHYYADHGNPTPTGPISGNVSVVIREGQKTQVVQNYPFTIVSANPNNYYPGDNVGPDWADIAEIELFPPP